MNATVKSLQSFSINLTFIVVRAEVLHGIIVATLGSKTYHWGALIAADIFANGS